MELSEEKISDAVTGVLESIAFVLAEPCEVDDQEFSRYARIQYSGPGEESEVVLSATDGFLCELASNLLGTDISEISVDVEGVQALTELANIVCGEVVLMLGSEEQVYSLGLPEILLSDDIQHDDSSMVGCGLESDGEYLRVYVSRHST